MTQTIEAAVMAGMSLGKFDGRRTAVILTPQNLRDKVSASDLRVPSTSIARTVGAAGAELVAWAQRGNVVGVVWRKGDKVRYTEGAARELLSAPVIAVMRAEKWTG